MLGSTSEGCIADASMTISHHCSELPSIILHLWRSQRCENKQFNQALAPHDFSQFPVCNVSHSGSPRHYKGCSATISSAQGWLTDSLQPSPFRCAKIIPPITPPFWPTVPTSRKDHLQNHTQRGSWIEVDKADPQRQGHQVLDCIWVYTYKTNQDGTLPTFNY